MAHGHGDDLYLARHSGTYRGSEIAESADFLSSLICARMLPAISQDVRLLVCDWSALALVSLFNWDSLTTAAIEAKFKELPESFLKFIFKNASRLPLMYAEPFEEKEDVPTADLIYFYNHISRSFSQDVFMNVLEPLVTFAGSRGEGVTFNQFIQIAEAKHSRMKDMPVEWIIEVLV